jgi:hypothetical protein
MQRAHSAFVRLRPGAKAKSGDRFLLVDDIQTMRELLRQALMAGVDNGDYGKRCDAARSFERAGLRYDTCLMRRCALFRFGTAFDLW